MSGLIIDERNSPVTIQSNEYTIEIASAHNEVTIQEDGTNITIIDTPNSVSITYDRSIIVIENNSSSIIVTDETGYMEIPSHIHDDRYYTKAEIDNKIIPNVGITQPTNGAMWYRES